MSKKQQDHSRITSPREPDIVSSSLEYFRSRAGTLHTNRTPSVARPAHADRRACRGLVEPIGIESDDPLLAKQVLSQLS